MNAAVAVILERRDRIGMFKRSACVAHDAGLWHCVTGYLPPETSPLAQALQELHEETGLTAADIDQVRTGPVLDLRGDDGVPWQVHTFTAHTTTRKLTLNWEHDAYRWVKARHVRGFTQVHWLSTVMTALEVGEGFESPPEMPVASHDRVSR